MLLAVLACAGWVAKRFISKPPSKAKPPTSTTFNGPVYSPAIGDNAKVIHNYRDPQDRTTIDLLLTQLNHANQEKAALTEQMLALQRKSLEEALQEGRAPHADPVSLEITQALERGDWQTAQDKMLELEQRASQQAKDHLASALSYAKRIGYIWLGNNTEITVAAFTRAYGYDPKDVEVLDGLVRGHIALGDLEQAKKFAQQLLDICQARCANDPSNSQWQRDLSVSFDWIGDIQQAQGALDLALRSFQDGLALRKVLAQRDPSNSQWQRDLSVSFDRIGDIQKAQGALDLALRSFQDGLALRKVLAQRDPSNSEWQSDWAVSLLKVGNIPLLDRQERLALLKQSAALLKDLEQKGALHHYQKDWPQIAQSAYEALAAQ